MREIFKMGEKSKNVRKIRKLFRKIPLKVFLYIGSKQDGSLVSQTQIARDLNIPITTINYHITRFKQEGLINRHLELTEKGKKLFKAIASREIYSMRLRAHNIQIKFRVIKCPNGFPNCYLRKGIYEPCTNRRYSGLKTELLGCKVMFYSPRKIICVLPNIYTNTDEEISSRIMLVVSDLKEALEQEFEGIRIDDYEIARIQTMHVAVLNAIIAKTFLIKGLTYSSKKIAIDKSHGIPEIEITDPAVSLDYIEKLLKILENGN